MGTGSRLVGVLGLAGALSAIALMAGGPVLAAGASKPETAVWAVVAGDYTKTRTVPRLELLTPRSPKPRNMSAAPDTPAADATVPPEPAPQVVAQADAQAAGQADVAPEAKVPEAKVPEAKTAEAETAEVRAPEAGTAETSETADVADAGPDVAGNREPARRELEQSGRYALVELGTDILRVDREAGTVSVCEDRNGAWRCVPVPQAEQAYLAEIDSLNAEISALNARIAALQADLASALQSGPGAAGTPGLQSGEGAPETAPSAPPQAGAQSGEAPSGEPGKGDGQADDPARPEAGEGAPEPQLSQTDEEELEEILDFTEMAMRRFFGLMKELQGELDGADPAQ
ncbi:hypothetical protein GCM10011316_21070 [Roseibium aquae]|uniref:Uncharacterized protein n=1 Tax=Roseibium aquae TaxID=1323746 RepID=A0A916TKE3_9HYPH|nr:hypothetical protein [Roseibium aquae]GGB48733.1 hypothetical protein GCM10011316_21070 [Roseibium aquae]